LSAGDDAAHNPGGRHVDVADRVPTLNLDASRHHQQGRDARPVGRSEEEDDIAEDEREVADGKPMTAALCSVPPEHRVGPASLVLQP